MRRRYDTVEIDLILRRELLYRLKACFPKDLTEEIDIGLFDPREMSLEELLKFASMIQDGKG